MNSRQLQYAILLSQIRNFSQVAENLNISQPALSKQILSLESELDLKLFDRTTTPLTVTPAGQYFLQEAQELLYKEDQLLRSMDRFKSGEAGQLVIGVTPFRSSYLIADIVKACRTAFPHIQVKLQEAGTDILRKASMTSPWSIFLWMNPYWTSSPWKQTGWYWWFLLSTLLC